MTKKKNKRKERLPTCKQLGFVFFIAVFTVIAVGALSGNLEDAYGVILVFSASVYMGIRYTEVYAKINKGRGWVE